MKLSQSLILLKRTILVSTVAYISWSLASVVWLVLPVESVMADKLTTQILSMQENKPVDLNINNVVALNLFGISEAKTTNQRVIKEHIVAPETSLRLKLRGLRKGQGNIPSSAIIENSKNSQDIYYLGDEVPGSSKATIYKIYSQRLILKRGGKYETLTLFEILQQKNNNQTKDAKQVDNKSIDTSAVKRRTPMIDKTRNKALTNKLTEIAEKVGNSPLSLSGTMIINPVENDNGFQGYRVAPGGDRLLFAHLGFKKGDVITSVNDVQLDSAGKIMSLMNVLSSAQELEIEIMRGSQPLAYRYKVR